MGVPKGYKFGPEVGAKISAANMGHKVSLETRQKISAARTGLLLVKIEDRGYKTPCWIWLGAKSVQGGYGVLRRNGKTYKAHRWLWEQEHGPLSLALDPHHRCEQKDCVRLDHLEIVTRTEHAARHKGKLGRKKKIRPPDPQTPAAPADDREAE